MLDRIAPECEYRRKEAGKRSLFGFPKDPVRLQKWLKLIPRADFKPSKQSKLCEIHFEERFFRKTACAFRKDGTKVEAKLIKPQLLEDAVPTHFPNNFPVVDKKGRFRCDLIRACICS